MGGGEVAAAETAEAEEAGRLPLWRREEEGWFGGGPLRRGEEDWMW